MIALKTQEQVEAIGRAGAIIARLFEALEERIAPGVSTADVDSFVETFIRGHDGAVPAFKGLYGFPASACVSVNDEVVHGIPRRRRTLAEGDLASIDVGVQLDGWFADAAVTFGVGRVDAQASRLLAATREALRRAIDAARAGNRLGDIGHAVQSYAESEGFSVVRDLVGHGIGREPHEEPQVPNIGQPGRGLRLEAGMVLAIEPMINEGLADVRTLEDRWTVVTADRKRSAHFEHTVALTENGPRILTGCGRDRPQASRRVGGAADPH
ncbi:MAG: type I methionyl aminopeptidase [Longimicrobiales bacterium]